MWTREHIYLVCLGYQYIGIREDWFLGTIFPFYFLKLSLLIVALFSSTFVENFLAVLLVISVGLLVVKGGLRVPKRLVYFRENH